ncbi:MAG: hypothetical protein IJK23_08855 [Clostridia bacterium]|nr:hypothetical protein [Clostridia bacterium]
MKFINVKNSPDVAADGKKDDTKALQSCLDAAEEGGTVYFPDGIYLISAALIFYSGQHLIFSDGATLLRSAKSEPVTRYILASYSEPSVDGYDGTHDVVIRGGTFDGNAETDEFLTIVNTVRCTNITVEGCRFVHGAGWHCIEFNSTRGATVRGCTFDGASYTRLREDLSNELIQTDAPDVNSYGPVYDCDGKLIDFRMGKTPCEQILIENNLFKCAGYPAIGNHGDHAHREITIRGNIFDGPCATEDGRSRGYVTFMPHVTGIRAVGNVFLTHGTDPGECGIFQIKNPDPDALSEENNLVL